MSHFMPQQRRHFLGCEGLRHFRRQHDRRPEDAEGKRRDSRIGYQHQNRTADLPTSQDLRSQLLDGWTGRNSRPPYSSELVQKTQQPNRTEESAYDPDSDEDVTPRKRRKEVGPLIIHGMDKRGILHVRRGRRQMARGRGRGGQSRRGQGYCLRNHLGDLIHRKLNCRYREKLEERQRQLDAARAAADVVGLSWPEDRSVVD